MPDTTDTTGQPSPAAEGLTYQQMREQVLQRAEAPTYQQMRELVLQRLEELRNQR